MNIERKPEDGKAMEDAGVYDIARGGMVLHVLLKDLKVAGYGWPGRSGKIDLQGDQPEDLTEIPRLL